MTRDRAMELALGMMARRSRSEAEIRSALLRRGAAAGVATRVVGRLRRLGYLDDGRLADDLAARLYERGFGSLRVESELARLDVAAAIVERVTIGAAEERTLARRALERRFSAADLRDRKSLGRAARFLAGRGFPGEVIDSLFDVWD